MADKTYRSRADGDYTNAAHETVPVKLNERIVLTEAEFKANPGKFDPGTPTPAEAKPTP